MKCVVIEDETNSKILIQEMLHLYFPDIHLVGVGDSVEEGKRLINLMKPDVVLLDIEIAGGTGFDILDSLEQTDVKVIFITGYEQYAIRAIRYATVDYLLKPVNVEELRTAFDRLMAMTNSREKLSLLKQNVQSSTASPGLMVPTGTGYQIVSANDIAYLEADGAYVYLHLINAPRILATHSLGYFENVLDPEVFYRIHKSCIINAHKLSRVITKPQLQVELSDGSRLDLAVRRKDDFMDFLKKNHLY